MRNKLFEVLGTHEDLQHEVTEVEIERKKTELQTLLMRNKIAAREIHVIKGPSVSLFNIHVDQKVRKSSMGHFIDSVTLPYTGVRAAFTDERITIEIPNDNRSVVPLRNVLESKAFQDSDAALPYAVGWSVGHGYRVIDLAETPNLLLAGATKQGKSMAVHALLASLLYARQPSEIEFTLIDPKGVDFGVYRPLLGKRVIIDAAEAADTLRRLCDEMERRYTSLSESDAKENQLQRPYPYIVIIIDEFQDLTWPFGSSKTRALAHSISDSVTRLAQKGNPVGIHLVMTTQRPSRDVITPLVKVNFTTRMAFRVITREDSLNIIDAPGAECLIGSGDMLLASGSLTERIQGTFLSGEETAAMVATIAGI